MRRFSLLRFALPALYLAFAPVAGAQDLVDFKTSSLADLPALIYDPIVGAVDGDPIVLGGWSDASDSAAWSDDAWVLIDEADQWTRLPNLDGVGLLDAASVIVGNSLVLIGGRSSDGWSAGVTRIAGSGEHIEAGALPELPETLSLPAATSSGQTITVAGFSDSGVDAANVRIFRIDLSADEPAWSQLPGVQLDRPGHLSLASQDGGINLTSDSDDGSGSVMHRHTPLDAWTERSGPDTRIEIRSAMPIGQAHIAYVTRTPSGEHVVYSYSVITDTWTPMGRLDSAGDRAVATPLSSSLLTVEPSIENGRTSVTETKFEVGKRHFFWLDYVVVTVYLLAMILIGVYFSRREKGTEDFFVGGRKMPWWAVGFSLYATGTSAISFMAIPAKSYATDWLYLAQNAIGLVAIIPVALIIVPLIRRLSLTTTYEYLEMRFHVSIRLMGSILNMIYQLGARMSVVLFLPALALSAVTGVGVVESIVFMGIIATAYTVLGGIKAVIWTDVAQVFVLLGGAFLCLVIIVMGIDGGLGELLAVASADDKMHMFDWRFDLTIPTMWLFLILATTSTVTWPSDQVMVQRVLSTKTAKEAGKSVWTLMLIVIPGSLLFFSLGTALFGFYKLNPERLSPLLNLDATLPYFIASELPVGVAGLIIAALFAASMSTLDSSMNSVSTLIVVDFYQRFKKNVTDAQSLRLAKWITVITGIFGTVFAIILSRYSLPSLWDMFIMLTGLLGGGFGGVYALGMFTRRANWQGAMVGIVTSIFAALAVKAYTPIHVLLYGGVAIITCIVVGYLVSLLFPPQHDQLRGLTVFKVDEGNHPSVN